MTSGRVEGGTAGSTSAILQALTRGQDPSLPDRASSDLREEVVRHGLHLALARIAPPEVGAPLTPELHSALARQTVMRRQLRRLLRRFAEAGIPASPLKGPHVADGFYSDPTLRPFTDIDLLVPAERLDDALDLIRADPQVTSIPPKRPDADKRDIPVSDPSGLAFSLDLHWDLFSYSQLRGAADGATEEAWARARFVEDDLGPRYEFPIEVTLAFLCLHALLDHRFRLILFRDLAEAASHVEDWGPFVDYVTRWNLRSYVLISLELARSYAGAEIPDWVLDRIKPRYLLMSVALRMLGRVDITRFDGHRVHPLNLALVLLHDRLRERVLLALRAPLSYPEWRRRIQEDAGRPPVRPNLMLLVSTDRRRGAEVFGERLADGLERRGWRVDFVSLRAEGDGPSVRSHALDRESRVDARLDLGLVWRLRRRIGRTDPDVVLANGGSTLRYAVAALAGLRGPHLAYGSIGDPGYWMRNTRLAPIHRALHRRPELILAVSEHTRSSLISLFGLPPTQVVTAPTGVPEEFFAEDGHEPHHELRLLFMGNLSEEKDPLTALEIAGDPALREDVQLRIVGSGPLEPALRKRSDELRLENVEFAGSVEDVMPHLAWADVLLLPSKTEGLPGAVMEAAAAGVPAIAYDVGGTRELVLDGSTGILVPAGDLDRFKAAVDALRHDRSRLRELGLRARKHVQENYSMDKSIDGYHRALRQLLSRRPR